MITSLQVNSEETYENNQPLTSNSINSNAIMVQSDIVISQAVEIIGIDTSCDLQHAIPYSHNREMVDKELLLDLNKLTTLLCLLNLPYLFKVFAFYVIRISFMLVCQYFGVFKKTIFVTNGYIGGCLINMFFIRPLLLITWFHLKQPLIFSFECFQIPFESILIIKLNILRKKIQECETIPIAQHHLNDTPLFACARVEE